MKFSDIAKGNRAVKEVGFRLGNAPLINLKPGEPLPRDEYYATCGLRILTGEETKEIYRRSREQARAEAGIEQWLDTDPLCRMYEMAHTLHIVCVDMESGDRCEPFFASVDDVLKSPALGSDNIAYLYEQHHLWQDENSLKTNGLTIEQVLTLIAAEADRPENAESPLARMRPSIRESFLHTTARLFVLSATDRSLSGSIASLATTKKSSEDERSSQE